MRSDSDNDEGRSHFSHVDNARPPKKGSWTSGLFMDRVRILYTGYTLFDYTFSGLLMKNPQAHQR